MTYPFGAYICGGWISTWIPASPRPRRFYALDDCGTRINPLIIEGQVHGGLTEAFAIAMGQEIAYDEIGNGEGCPRSWISSCRPPSKSPRWETDFTVTPSPASSDRRKGRW